MTIQLIDNVPIPAEAGKRAAGKRKPKYPFHEMKVGQMFKVGAEVPKDRILAAFYRMRKRNETPADMKIVVGKTEDNLLGVWRTA